MGYTTKRDVPDCGVGLCRDFLKVGGDQFSIRILTTNHFTDSNRGGWI
jgi:hypothetical protein